MARFRLQPIFRACRRAFCAAWRTLRVAFWASKVLAKILLKFLPPSLEVFLHGGFGERYALRMIGSIALFWLYRRCALMVAGIAGSESERAFLDLYGLAFVALAFLHALAVCVRRFRGGGESHSRSSGEPWVLWERIALPQWFTAGVVEPGICFCMALAIRPHASALALWLEASSVALFTKTHLSWFSHRRSLLDALDARIEGRQLSSRLQERLNPHRQAANRFFVAESEEGTNSTTDE